MPVKPKKPKQKLEAKCPTCEQPLDVLNTVLHRCPVKKCTCGERAKFTCELCDGPACTKTGLTPTSPQVSFCCKCLDGAAC